VELDAARRFIVSTTPKKVEPIYTTPEAEGFTQEEIDDLIAEIESDDYDLLENAIMIIRPRGRQSLTAPGVHSTLVSTRVPASLLDMLKARAESEGVSVSEVQRRALSEYVGHPPS
jgi:hypothetical protein